MASKIKIYIKEGNKRINIPGVSLNFLAFLATFGFNLAKAFARYAKSKSDGDLSKAENLKHPKEKGKISLNKDDTSSDIEREDDYDIDDLSQVLNKLETEDIRRIIRVFKEHEPFTLVHIIDGDTEVLIRTL